MNVQFAVRETPTLALLDRTLALEGFSAFRQEWESVAKNESLIDISASVGLMLFDLTRRLGLTSDEQAHVLGDQLFHDALRKVSGNSM